MPTVSKKAIQEFQNIWLSEFGETISDQEALQQATSLLTLMDAVYKPIRKEWIKD